MSKLRYFSIIFLGISCLISACDTSNGNYVGARCILDSDCMGLVCVNTYCIEKCSEDSCPKGQTCNAQGVCEAIATPTEPECSETKPCPNGGICENSKCVAPQAPTRCNGTLCPGDQICINGYCIDKCTENSCTNGQFCGADGICVSTCTATSCLDTQYCAVDGQCLEKCQPKSCQDGFVCTIAGQCTEGVCSDLEPCTNGDNCVNGQCISNLPDTCYEDSDCPEGFGCDNQKCVDENSCSLTRTCADDRLCRDGMCVDNETPECSKSIPCTDTSKTCIAGQCVTCNCQPGETCVGNNRCVPADKAGNFTVGDSCTWTAEFAHCDNNRMVSCTTEMGSDDFRIGITDCGPKICSDTSEEGLGCHEACVHEGDYYGVCIDFYGGTTAFTHVCEQTDHGNVWTLKYGYTDCIAGCTNGRCNFVPPEFGENCTETSYPDACQGKWLSYCYYGYKTGTYCETYSSEHFCALPGAEAAAQGIIGNCAKECSTKGATHTECIQDEEGNVYSMTYLCAETADGRQADFEAGYIQCNVSCNIETGKCN